MPKILKKDIINHIENFFEKQGKSAQDWDTSEKTNDFSLPVSAYS